MRSEAEKMTVGQVFRRILRFSLVSIIPPMLNTQFRLHVARTRMINGRSLETLQKAKLLQESGSNALFFKLIIVFKWLGVS
jgi:hypothetical protein